MPRNGANRKNVMLAYADNIVLLGDTEKDVVKATEKLIESSRKIKLTISEEKPKYLVMTWPSVNKTALKVGPLNKWMNLNILELT